MGLSVCGVVLGDVGMRGGGSADTVEDNSPQSWSCEQERQEESRRFEGRQNGEEEG